MSDALAGSALQHMQASAISCSSPANTLLNKLAQPLCAVISSGLCLTLLLQGQRLRASAPPLRIEYSKRPMGMHARLCLRLSLLSLPQALPAKLLRRLDLCLWGLLLNTLA
jgi:hypothetical protein